MSRVATVLSFERGTRDGVPIEEIKVDSGLAGANVDPTTHEHHLPPGDDSAPLPGDSALLVEVEGGTGEEVIAAYSDPKNAGQAAPGEKRFYSRDASGDPVAEVWLKLDGTVVVTNLGGKSLEMAPNGDITIKGKLTVEGEIVSHGEVTANGLVPAAAVKLSTHLHGFTGPSGPVLTPTPGT